MERPKKVMVVDDEPDTLRFLCTWLEDQGHAPRGISDPEAVLESALKDPPDLLLLDIQMPNRSGVEVYRSLRENAALSSVPVIFITGASEVQLFGRGCAPLPPPAGRIEKPIDLEWLKKTMERAFQKAGAG